jgi:DNA-binding PadR family transcriptional regulator
MLDIAILGLLKESDLHGYELRRRLKDELGLSFSVSFGSLYPTLAKLTQEGAIEVIQESGKLANKIPSKTMSTGSLTGNMAMYRSLQNQTNADKTLESKELKSSKNKKIYRITSKGEELLVNLLNSPNENETNENETRNFTVRLAFSKYLPATARALLLKRRMQDLEYKLNELESKLKLSEANSAKSALIERSIALIRADISWLDHLELSDQEILIHGSGIQKIVEVNQKKTNSKMEEKI